MSLLHCERMGFHTFTAGVIALSVLLSDGLQAQSPESGGLVNVSTRLRSAAGDFGLFGGFIITGNAPKRILIRALGPSLTVPGTLPDPILILTDGHGYEVYNNNWRQNEQIIQDTGIPPNNDLESAIVAELAPGAYTAIVDDIATRRGIALVEVYDLGTVGEDSSKSATLAEISTRGPVETGDDVMIGGFITTGGPTKVIIRAIGPSLQIFGFSQLQDTTLNLHDGSGSLMASNDDWRSDQEQAIIDTGVPPTDDRESAIIATLAAGAYTAIVRGKDGGTGVGLVEVYALQ